MHSVVFVAILFLSPASAAPALNACPNIDPVAIGVSSPVKAPRLIGNWREMLVARPNQKPKKMTCDASCADYCWLVDSDCLLAGGSSAECLAAYQNCICSNHCCTPDDEPSYCQ
jgi:hypothetical protein